MIKRLIGTIILYITAGGLQALMGDDGAYDRLEVVYDGYLEQYEARLVGPRASVVVVAIARDQAIRDLIDLLIAGKGASDDNQ